MFQSKPFLSFALALLIAGCGGGTGFQPTITGVKTETLQYGKSATIYLGGKDLVCLFSNKKLVEKPYFINQFSFENMIRIFHKNRFTPTFYLDKATKLSKEHEISKNYNVYRKIFIIIGRKY